MGADGGWWGEWGERKDQKTVQNNSGSSVSRAGDAVLADLKKLGADGELLAFRPQLWKQGLLEPC